MNVVLTLLLLTGIFSTFHSCTSSGPDTPSTYEPQVVRILDETGDTQVKLAIEEVTKCLQNPSFLKAVREYKFKYTEDLNSKIVEKLKYSTVKGKVKFYTYWNPFSSVHAYAENGTIFLNTRKFPKTVLSISKTILHEYTHLLGYTHPFNNTIDRDESVPYAAAELAAINCF